IHLQSDLSEEAGPSNGDVHNLYFYSLIAVFILLMAWINYINLSTAQAIQRAKEVGVRKSIGAGKGQLVGQFMTESILINLSASTLAVIIAYLLLPVLNELVGEEIEFTIIQTLPFGYILL